MTHFELLQKAAKEDRARKERMNWHPLDKPSAEIIRFPDRTRVPIREHGGSTVVPINRGRA